MISIIDYGMGNLRSVEKALRHIGAECRMVMTPEEVAKAEKLIVPGVGAFGDAMRGLAERNLIGSIREYARSGRPVMGICLGMQVFFDSSDEDPGVEGLSLIPGSVKRFRESDLKVPHMGWNNLDVAPSSRLLSGLGDEPYVYFVHSYYVVPNDDGVSAAKTTYDQAFTAAVETGNIYGTQFHPEKSQDVGLRILRNFAELG